MLVLSADVRRAITAVLGRDRAAHVTAESAAAMHLGSAPLSPVVVAAQGPEPSPLVRIVPLPEVRATVLLEGLRVATVESTIVELCARPTRPLAALLAGDLLRRGFDGKSLVLIARASSAAARRRVAFLLSRGGHEELARRVLPEERAGAVKLDPLGPAGGPMDGRTRVVVGVADGFSLPRDGERFVALVRAALGPRDKEIALLVGLGFPLIDPPAEAIERGLVSRAPDGWVPRPPFDEACARIDVDARARRRVIEGLARRDDPRCRVDAALLELDPEAGALRLSPEMASAIDGPRARAAVARLGEPLGPERRRALLERVGAWTEAA
ncbi:MAG: hypothetical protein K1X94_36945, partial [Sandaracinaceae bacterium]|nr:hypothetical protein [Sandaracinaceae bacterium]